MVDTRKSEPKVDRAILEERGRRFRQYAANMPQYQDNPLWGRDPREPSSYLSVTYGDPQVGEPLPSGLYVDPRVPSPTAISRAEDIRAFQNNPRAYVEQNAQELNNEQSLMDRGKTMLARIFDYRDEADLEVFGVNLSAVEATWDGFLRHLIGGYDLLNIGFGGLLSAAPGGLPTLTYDELSGGRTVGEVLSGEMEFGDAPSPGQIALTSIGIEAARIRSGNARLSDVLLANPFTGPFILAALAADDSPIQDPEFDIMNQEQREEAFGQGWEKWMSGITDAGLMLADPLIGAGVGIKILRRGALGQPGGVKEAAAFSRYADDGVNNTMETVYNLPGRTVTQSEQELIDLAMNRISRGVNNSTADVKLGLDLDPRVIDESPFARRVTQETDTSAFTGTYEGFLLDVVRVDSRTGVKIMDKEAISRRLEINENTMSNAIADALYETTDIITANLILKAAMGVVTKTPDGTVLRAQDILSAVAPAIGDMVMTLKRIQYQTLARTEPQKAADAIHMLNRSISNVEQQIAIKEAGQTSLLVNKNLPNDISNVSDANKGAWQNLEGDLARLRQTRDEAVELVEIAAGRKIIDDLDYTSPFYNEEYAARVIDDLHRSQDAAMRATNAALEGSALSARIRFPTKRSPYTEMVMRSRERRSEAAFQYGREGTSIFPRRTLVEVVDGEQIRLPNGWFSPSQFPGTSRVRRAVRIWRWAGEANPAGWLGLKGTSTVNAEVEMRANLKLDYLRGDGIRVTRTVADEAGGPGATRVETTVVGGQARQQQFMDEWLRAIDNPDADPFKTLLNIEDAITRDYALLYNLPEEKLLQITAEGAKRREAHMKSLRDKGAGRDGGYFIDPYDGSINHSPWLEVHAANGTFMQPFAVMEKTLRRAAKQDKNGALRGAFDVGSQAAASGYNLFNNFWRPMTLMRLSYTQRNVFENMLRAMAYNSSLAPMAWPVAVGINTTRNALVNRRMKKQVAKATKTVDESTYGVLVREHMEAVRERSALEIVTEVPAIPGEKGTIMLPIVRADGTRGNQRITKAEYERRYNAANDKVDAAYERMSANIDAYDASVANTPYGDWRAQQLRALEQEQKSLLQESSAMNELMLLPDVNGRVFNAAEYPIVARYMNELQDRIVDVANKHEALLLRPADGIADYQLIAGRQRRIGSGTSVGPDGNYYNDAFTGLAENINRALMSSDNTIKQSLSLRFSATESLFYRAMVKQNQAIPFTPETRQQWVAGMLDNIDDYASSRIVQELLRNNFDIEKTILWMQTTQRGRDFYQKMLLQQGDSVDVPVYLSDAATNAPQTVGSRVGARTSQDRLPIGETTKTPAGEKMVLMDMDATTAYVADVATRLRASMQEQEVFMALLRRRAAEFERTPEGTLRTGTGARSSTVDEAAVEAALNSLPADAQAKLGFVMGDEILQMGAYRPMEAYATLVNKMFRFLGQMPEDAIARGPFYNDRFKATRNVLIEQYWEGQGFRAADIKKRKRAKTRSGQEEPMTLAHEEFVIPARELSRIEVLSHRQALNDTREWMYTIERRTNLGKYGEWVFPFVSAAQNSTVAIGKLLYKEPWLAPFAANLWRMPTRLGIEDENGNLQLPMPLPWVRDFLADNPDIPFLGGVVGPDDMIRMPKMGFNVIAPESGFGLVPRPSPWVQVPASELMKANMFPVETPQLLRNALGDEAAEDVYTTLKDYMFGEGRGVSASGFSVDMLVPAWIKRGVETRSELSRQYGYQYQLQWHTQTARWRAGDRDTAPTEEEINKRTTNTFLFMMLGNLGIPTPLTPYPILTRPQIDTPVSVLQDTYQKYQAADPVNASFNFQNQFGDWALEMANSKITTNVGGATPHASVISDINTFSDLIRRAAPNLGDNLEVLGIVTNNRVSQQEYENSAYRYQTAKRIPGTNRLWREVLSPQMSTAERQRIAGWTLYRQTIDRLDAMLENAGFTSYESTGASELKAARTRFINNMLENPDYAGWSVDYLERSGDRTLAAIRLMEFAVNDETFRNELIRGGNEQVYGIMSEYLYYRRGVVNILRSTGTTINNPANIELKIAWENLRQKWKNRSVRWAEIHDLYLSGDDNPANPGAFVEPMLEAAGGLQ